MAAESPRLPQPAPRHTASLDVRGFAGVFKPDTSIFGGKSRWACGLTGSDMYSRFVTDSPQLSDLAFNRKVVDVMDKAKTFARIRRQGRWRTGPAGNEPGSTLAPALSIDLIEAGQRGGE